MAMAVLHNGTTMATTVAATMSSPTTVTATSSTPTNEELWRECVTWLTRWEMLRHDHKVNWPTATITDFATILRDGVLLCRLLNKIDPGCIDMKDVNLKPTMAQFLCKKNINLFLKTCEISFGLQANDLFEDSMLYDLTNFHKVLCTLSKLSLTPKALKNNIPGFQAHKTTEEEVIYQQLKSVDIPSKSHRSSSGIENVDIMTSDEIYQHLCEVQRHPEQNVFEKRDYVIKELLETEKNYVDVLNKLRRNFMLPLKDIMNPDDFNVVFHKISELHQVHSAFYAELTKAKTTSNSKFSAVFMKWREKFLVYGKYCANLTKATNLLQELCDNDNNFNQKILEFENVDSNGRFKLRDVLSVPMQRILKYHLLLDKLVENTDPNDEEYNELRRAREAMIDVAGFINEAARDSEHLAVINNVQESITDMIPGDGGDFKLSNHGRLIKDCELKIKPHNDQRMHNRYVFIFDKSILICKQPKKESKFAFRDILNLSEYHTEECHNRAILNKDARFSYCFLLVKNNNQNVFTIYLKSAELKQQVMKAINDALENLHPIALKHTNHAFELQTFNNPTQCNHCSKYLKGLIFQGYRCASCGIAAHKSCISSSGRCGSTPTPTSSNSNSSTNANSSLNNSFELSSTTDGGLCHLQYHPLQDRLWFAGEMDRDTAQEQLRERENGTYLVRIRPQKDDKEKYALTLKTADAVKHMIIYSNSADVPSYKRKYFLSPCKYFNSIDELVINYQFNSLKENFERLEKDTKLLWPYKQLLAVANRTFDTRNSKELSFTEGDYIRIIGREGYKEGWLRGRNRNNEVGYLPANYVHIEGEVNYDESA